MTGLIQFVQQETDALFLAQQSPKHFDASTVSSNRPRISPMLLHSMLYKKRWPTLKTSFISRYWQVRVSLWQGYNFLWIF